MVQGPDSNLILFNWWVFMHQYFSHINYGVLMVKRFSKHRKKCLWINLHLKESLFVQFFYSFSFFSTANYMFSKQILWWADVAIIAKCGCGLHGVNSQCGWVCFCAAKDEKEFSLFLSWFLELLVDFETASWAPQSRQRERKRKRERTLHI